MNADAAHKILAREPFQPFVIRFSSGEAREVRHPECAIVMRTKVLVYYPETDRCVYCALKHVNAVEALQAT